MNGASVSYLTIRVEYTSLLGGCFQLQGFAAEKPALNAPRYFTFAPFRATSRSQRQSRHDPTMKIIRAETGTSFTGLLLARGLGLTGKDDRDVVILTKKLL